MGVHADPWQEFTRGAVHGLGDDRACHCRSTLSWTRCATQSLLELRLLEHKVTRFGKHAPDSRLGQSQGEDLRRQLLYLFPERTDAGLQRDTRGDRLERQTTKFVKRIVPKHLPEQDVVLARGNSCPFATCLAVFGNRETCRLRTVRISPEAVRNENLRAPALNAFRVQLVINYLHRSKVTLLSHASAVDENERRHVEMLPLLD